MHSVEEVFEELNECHENDYFDDRKVEEIIRDDRANVISEVFEKVGELLGRVLDGSPHSEEIFSELEILRETTISEACE